LYHFSTIPPPQDVFFPGCLSSFLQCDQGAPPADFFVSFAGLVTRVPDFSSVAFAVVVDPFPQIAVSLLLSSPVFFFL